MIQGNFTIIYIGEVMDGVHGNYKFKMVREEGHGTFGEVHHIELYNVADHHCGSYAIKFLKNLDPESNERLRRRFAREVAYQASCVHTNIANIYLCNLRVEQPWFIMDLAAANLSRDLSGGMSLKGKVSAFNMVLNGIKYMHDKGFLHRDIKPDNVLRFAGGVYKVSDFGLVKNLNKEMESEVLTQIFAGGMGTPYFMAPEAFEGVYTERSDIYSLGALMRHMKLTSEDEFDSVISKCTMNASRDRYVSVAALQEDFRRTVEGVIRD